MYGLISALLGALLSLTGVSANPNNVVGTARLAGPVTVNGRTVTSTALVTSGDRVETGAGGVMVLSLSSTDRLILGEHSSINLRTTAEGVTAEVNIGRMQVNTTHQRLHEVRLTDEGIAINAEPGQPREYMVTRLANASYVAAKRGSLRMVDEGYGDSETIPEGMVGTARTVPTHIDPPDPQRTQPVSTGSGARAGSITALNPKGYIQRTNSREEAAKGKDIFLNDKVNTEAAGRMRMVLADGSILNLGSGSSMTIQDHNASTRNSTIELASGRIRAQVRGMVNPSGQEWQIKTNTAICGVLGTDFFVETDGTKTRLVVFEGKVKFTPLVRGLVAAASSAVTVIAGQTSSAVAGAVASPVASGASASSAAAATSIAGQGATSAGTAAATSAARIGVVTAAAAPTAAGAAVIGASVAANSSGPNSSLTISNGVVSGTNP